MTESLGKYLGPYLEAIAPKPCDEELFVKMNFANAFCVKLFLAKVIGYLTIVGSTLVRIPQIIKLLMAGSAEGVSFTGNTLELVAMSSGAAYGFALKYPFSAYGEGFFLAVQTFICGYLILYYNGKAVQAVLFASIYVGIMAYLLSPAVYIPLVTSLQALNIPMVAMGKSIQIVANYRNGSTGQLSFIMIALLFLGAALRVFTSIQETGDPLVIGTYVMATFCNGVLFFQILWYWKATDMKLKRN